MFQSLSGATVLIFIQKKPLLHMDSKNTTLIMFAVLAAFGLIMATIAVLPIVPQVNAATRIHKDCNNAPHPPPCGKKKVL